MVDAMENLQALLGQEHSKYRTMDYMTRMQSDFSFQTLAQESKSCSSGDEPTHSPPSSPGCDSRMTSRKRKEGPPDVASQDTASSKRLRTNEGTHEEASSPPPPSSSAQISRQWREKICEWAFKVVDHFDLRREIVNIAMNHLDRYLSACPNPVDKGTFQLLSMTCLYLAIKLNETRIIVIPGAKSSMDTLLQLSRGFFSLEEVERMECDILQRLQWHVHPPTPQLFVRTFLYLISTLNSHEINSHTELEIHGLANFMVELSVMDYYLAKYKASEIAMAAILNALAELNHDLDEDQILPLVNQGESNNDMDLSNIAVCRRRLTLIYEENKDAFYENSEDDASIDEDDADPRTSSPVCVVNAP